MSASQQSRPLTAEERARSLDVLADLLASTFDAQVSAAEVHRALARGNTAGGDDDNNSWRVSMMKCIHEHNTEVTSEAAQRDSQEWICPMCETVNWSLDARKTLRRQQEETSCRLSRLVTEPLRCECCGYDGTAAPP
ncbi:hypothetical protein LPMP_211910 [Leishmania panamensis]|uniref:Uncharacterized protein n=1 Tax=Leishmania panamensis TaxID=5679 RepID=A0A088RQM9_LEIPA|nr:hypothetical protein LPMP_211910 [Leishmania panamensis]AIN98268.1 hypothetical protein LPMP_211910 [Leishmania panamensis]